MYQVVIVDDEPYIVEGLTSAIDWNGYNIEIGLASSDPVAVLDYVLNNPVNILITDVSMPIMNGLQLIQKIKEVKPSIYVIVLSAYDNFEYARTALRYGAENYLLKPLDSDELSDTISQIISHIQEREMLDITYGRSMMTFRNTFTEQWLKNLLSNSDLTSKADLLGINLNTSSFTVAIFTCPEGCESMMSQFLDFLLHHLPGTYTGNFYFETPLRLVGVLSPVSDTTAEIKDFLMPIIRSSISSGIPLFASVGTTVTHYSEVPQSFAQAKLLSFLEYSPLHCVFYQNIPGLAEDVQNAMKKYDNSFCTDTAPIEVLYRSYEPVLCSWHILSERINELCQNKHKLSEYPENLTDILMQLPASDEDSSLYYDITMQFLTQSNQQLLKVQQSMYPIVDAVIKIVNEFSDQNISLKTLAARLNVTPAYLGTIFRQQTGFYFNDYLANARLKYAADLLDNTDMKIKDIVDAIGFSSQTYFNRSFKRFYGISPVNYRRDKAVRRLS